MVPVYNCCLTAACTQTDLLAALQALVARMGAGEAGEGPWGDLVHLETSLVMLVSGERAESCRYAT